MEKDYSKLIEQWNIAGENYATEINEMLLFVDNHGWENWKKEEAEDKRGNLSDGVLNLLKKANETKTVDQFRADFPPAHIPFAHLLQEKGQAISQLTVIDSQKILLMVGALWENPQCYLVENDVVTKMDANIIAIGKSKKNDIFAYAYTDKVVLKKSWDGAIIATFYTDMLAKKDNRITELIPFNSGEEVLLVTSGGIYVLSQDKTQLIHPNDDEFLTEDKYGYAYDYIDMENATLSHDNNYIVTGHQDGPHIVFDKTGVQIGTIGQQSEYPHYCLFLKDDSQLITNSCHFYNGMTIGVSTDKLEGIEIEPYTESDEYTIIDESMRVYAAVSSTDYYILGDAYGYIQAVDKNGKFLWRHYLGSTISGMALSTDEKTLWIGTHAGILHKLELGIGHRDTHTIGNGHHYETFRLLFWKNEENILKW